MATVSRLRLAERPCGAQRPARNVADVPDVPDVPNVPWLPALLLLLLAGCLAEPGQVRQEREIEALDSRPWEEPSHVVAEVNGRPITRGESYRRIMKKFGTRTVLSGILKEELFRQEGERLGIDVRPDEIDARVAEVLRAEASQAGGEEALAEIYRRQGLVLEDVRRDYARDLESHLLVGKVTQALRVVDDAALRGYYRETYAKTRYRVRHIPYAYPLQGFTEEEMARRKKEALEKAQRTTRRIRAGADFAQIARQESEDVTRDQGGDLGWVAEDVEMDPTMKNAIAKLKPGDVSEPVENNLRGAFHVVQVTEISAHRAYEECLESMKKELKEREPDLDEIGGVLQRLWTPGRVKIFGEERGPPEEGPEESPEKGPEKGPEKSKAPKTAEVVR